MEENESAILFGLTLLLTTVFTHAVVAQPNVVLLIDDDPGYAKQGLFIKTSHNENAK